VALSLRFGAVSDIGRIRKKNDDSGYAGPNLIVVADGMGGAPAGDLASAVTIQTVKRLDTEPPDDLLHALAGTILIANERLAEIIEDDPSVDGMGTTITAALFDGAQIGVAHLGDSRGYLLRDGELLPITRDHTWVQSLIDEGRLSEDEAKVHSHRSLLLKVLDGRHDNEPDLSTYDVQAGDRILICSDGLTGFVPPDRIQRVMAIGTPQSTAAELTALALESGSTDNVTVLVGDVVDEPPLPAEPLVVGAAGDRHRGPLTRLRTWAQRDEPEPGEMLMLDPSVDPEERRYAPRAPRRFLWLRRAALVVVALAIVGGGLAIAYSWSQTQYFVGARHGTVAIYQGVDAQLPGISLNHVYADQHLKLSQLPAFRRSQVLDGLPADSLTKAERIVVELRGFARICAGPGTPTTSPTKTLPPPPTSTSPSTPSGTVPPASGSPTSKKNVSPPTSLLPPGSQSPDSPRECAGSTPGGSR
jgi:PPM family protein phosphatase